MAIWKVIGIIALVHVGVIGLCLAALWLQRHFPDKNYDERQMLNRYKASNVSLLVGLIYYLVVMVILIYQVDGRKNIEPYLLVLFGILLQTTVDHTYCLFTHSALPLSQKPRSAIMGYLFCSAVQLLSFLINQDIRPLSLVGHGSSGWVNLTAGISFLYLALMHGLSLFGREKE
jgi:hypothetical protein